MTFLLDTHIVVWWWTDDAQLPADDAAKLDGAAERGEIVAISDISLWEINMLVDRGRLRIAASVETFLREVEEHPTTRVLPITSRIAAESTRLGPTFPRDPADRLIAATARCHGLALMTADRGLRESGTVAIA